MQLHKLLVVIDPTHREQAALQRAVWLAGRTGASLELLVCEYHGSLQNLLSGHPLAADELRGHQLASRLAWLEEQAAPMRADGLDVRCSVRWGHPLHQAILDQVQVSQPDLLITPAHHHNLLRRLLLSNHCWQLIRHCPVPLWLAGHGNLQHQRLAVALDPTHCADKPAALDHQLIAIARTLEAALGLEAHYVHSHAPLPHTLLFDAELVNDYQSYVETSQRAHREAFDQLLATYAIDPAHSHLLQGFAEETLPRFVEKRHIDLLLMGAIRRGELDNVLIGHTAERVLEGVECDLLVVKPESPSAS